MKPSQKLRVIVNRVDFFSTVKKVQDGVGDDATLNDAIRAVLNQLIAIDGAKVDGKKVSGLATTIGDLQIQINLR